MTATGRTQPRLASVLAREHQPLDVVMELEHLAGPVPSDAARV